MTDGLQKKINDKQIRFIEDGIPSRWDEKSVTHDELLAKIDDEAMLGNKEWRAFRAVIELHKPVMGFTGGYDGEENELWEEQCQECSANGFSQMYPCETIQVIEEELS